MSYAGFAGAALIGPFRMLVANGLQDLLFQRIMPLPIRERAATEKAALHR